VCVCVCVCVCARVCARVCACLVRLRERICVLVRVRVIVCFFVFESAHRSVFYHDRES
jgi:hypothetical protein